MMLATMVLSREYSRILDRIEMTIRAHCRELYKRNTEIQKMVRTYFGSCGRARRWRLAFARNVTFWTFFTFFQRIHRLCGGVVGNTHVDSVVVNKMINGQ